MCLSRGSRDKRRRSWKRGTAVRKILRKVRLCAASSVGSGRDSVCSWQLCGAVERFAISRKIPGASDRARSGVFDGAPLHLSE